MKTYVVVPASSPQSLQTFSAEKISDINKETVIFSDAKGDYVAVVSLQNVAAVYEEKPEE